ncbi:hypothetical protein F5888DRAFT_1951807 [Russula emetica]|nr:hypothetical protein F5888DRAFT_1951807 [Russula emetica]
MPPTRTRSGPPTKQEIWKIARRTTNIIEFYITSNVCLFGSAASSLWTDIDRVPNDIDVVISNEDCLQFDAEDIKETIVGADDRYYLKRSRKRGATHRILYCRLPGWATDNTRRVKVDILVPPTLNLPAISASETYLIKDIPVMPIFDLLVMKTQGWWDHRDHDRAGYRTKQSHDVSDIFALLKQAKYVKVSYVNKANEDRHSREFMNHARFLVNRFVRVHGGAQQWRALGFPV